MKTVLALSACAVRAEVALAAPGLPAPSLVALASPSPRGNLLLKGVETVLLAAGLSLSQVELIVATRGPGSFTGIRNTLACVLGLSQALGVPAHGFSSLLAQAARTSVPRLLAVQPARKGYVYVQEFVRHQAWEPASQVRVEPHSWLSQQTLPVVAPVGLPLPTGPSPAPVRWSTAEALLELAQQLSQPEPETLQPSYVEGLSYLEKG